MSDSVIKRASGVFAPGHLGELTGLVPPDMVDAVLAAGRGRQERVRRLPSRVVVYLLLAGALFEHLGWRQVWARLVAGLPGTWRAPSGSSLTEAMRRVGPDPLRALFDLLKGPGAVTARGAAWFADRLVVAIDGTSLPVADTVANGRVFAKPPAGPNGPAGYPLVRVVALVACGTRTLIEAVFGTDTVGELTYAARLVAGGALRTGMLLLGDRNFATYNFIATVAASGADLLIRAKTGHGAMRLPVLERLPDGSYLSRAGVTPVRVVEARITARTKDGPAKTGTYRLITTVLDPRQAPALTLVRLYHERWEVETAFLELKSTLGHGRVARARHPAGVDQEVWARLITYQVLRTAMADAVLARPDIDPDRASFTIALNTARDQITAANAAIDDSRADLVGRIGAAILADLLPARRPRTRDRVIKRAISKYRAKTRNPDRTTRPTSIEITILTTDPDG